MPCSRLRIGTRGSPLALGQAHWVSEQLQRVRPSIEVEVVPIVTSADKELRASLTAMGGKGLFVKEIEEDLLAGRIDLAVHSLKDVPTELPAGLILAAVPRREDPRDALVSRDRRSFHSLPTGSRIATSSLRRGCQLRAARGDIEIVPIRGNVGTRLAKIDRGEADAVIVAVAGLKRLHLEDRITEILAPDLMVPAIGQGALGIETRRGDPACDLVKALEDRETRACVDAERAFARALGATCRTPVGALGRLEGQRLLLEGVVVSLDGSKLIKDKVLGDLNQPEALGKILADALLDRGAGSLLKESL